MASHISKHGRSKAMGQTKIILLRKAMFDFWNQRKDSLGVKGLSNNAFARI